MLKTKPDAATAVAPISDNQHYQVAAKALGDAQEARDKARAILDAANRRNQDSQSKYAPAWLTQVSEKDAADAYFRVQSLDEQVIAAAQMLEATKVELTDTLWAERQDRHAKAVVEIASRLRALRHQTGALVGEICAILEAGYGSSCLLPVGPLRSLFQATQGFEELLDNVAEGLKRA